ALFSAPCALHSVRELAQDLLALLQFNVRLFEGTRAIEDLAGKYERSQDRRKNPEMDGLVERSECQAKPSQAEIADEELTPTADRELLNHPVERDVQL